MNRSHLAATLLFSAAMVATAASTTLAGQPFVPGTGDFLKDCCDDFEDAKWGYAYNHPKSSHEQDEKQRGPGGRSNSGLWHEGGKRGTPDVVKRISTPSGGIAGSTGSLLMATKNSGVPGTFSNSQQQDDLLMMFNRRLGRSIPMAWQPSCTVRVYLPPFEDWENRSGPSFGMRADCTGRNPDGSVEEYWPGMFMLFKSETTKGNEKDAAKLTIRGDRLGHDVRSLDIAEPGWWTLGMSFTADGQVHYYASPGVDDLTSEDFLLSSYPYGMHCMTMNNFFFNVANWDTGRTWSTPWVIDDPKVFVIPPEGANVAQLYKIKKKPQQITRKNTRQKSSTASRSTSSGSRGQKKR